MDIEGRYARNLIFTREEQQLLAGRTVFIAGCGGLGGYVAECLARAGVGRLVLADGDVFEASNLNRQLGATEKNLGCNKAEELKKRAAEINSQISVTALPLFIDEENGAGLLKDADLAIDALDSPRKKLMLQELCRQAGIPLVHGAVSGWQGQVGVIMPGDDTLAEIYPASARAAAAAAEKNAAAADDCATEAVTLASPPFTAAAAGSLEAARAVRLLLGREGAADRELLFFDLLTDSWYKLEPAADRPAAAKQTRQTAAAQSRSAAAKQTSGPTAAQRKPAGRKGRWQR